MSEAKLLKVLTTVNEKLDQLTTEVQELKATSKPEEKVDYLSRQQTADMLHISLATLWVYTKDKTLVSYGIGKRVYYKRREVEQAIHKLQK